jgi:hypothetical protein
MLEIYHRLLPGGILCGSTCTPVVAVAGQNPASEGALSSSPVLPALKSSKSGCLFEVGLAPTETHMVVDAPRSYLTPRPSSLADRRHKLCNDQRTAPIPHSNKFVMLLFGHVSMHSPGP